MNEKLQEVLSAVVESKVTRAEVVELALTSLREKLEADLADAIARLGGVDDSLSLPAALQILRSVESAGVEIAVKTRRKYNGQEYVPDGFDLNVSARLPQGFAFPKAYAVATREREVIEEEIRMAKRQLGRLSGASVKARAALIRMALDASPNGAKVSEARFTLS